MRHAILIILAALPSLAAIDGIVMNGTTGKLQSGIKVSLVQPGQDGMQVLASSESGANGAFKIEKDLPPPPALLQAEYQGVTYTQVLPPGQPTNGVQFQIFDAASKQPAGMETAHLMVIEPSAAKIDVTETFLIRNNSKLTFQDATRGSAQFYAPKGAGDAFQVAVVPPTQMPITRQAQKMPQPGLFKVDYPVRPGETRFDVHYSLPATTKLSGKTVKGDSPLRLAVPASVKLSGDGLQEMGVEPEVQARLYSVSGTSFEVNIEGTGSLHERKSSNDPQEDTGQPKTREIQARIYDRLYWVLGITFGILALGGTLLFRKGTAA